MTRAVQDKFFGYLRDKAFAEHDFENVNVFLVTGVRLVGHIIEFNDDYLFFAGKNKDNNNVTLQIIYRVGISTVMSASTANYPELLEMLHPEAQSDASQLSEFAAYKAALLNFKSTMPRTVRGNS